MHDAEKDKNRNVQTIERQHSANREFSLISRLTKVEWKRDGHSETGTKE